MVINKYLAELIGTFILVFVGSLSILAAGLSGIAPVIIVPFGFGLGLLAAYYAVGHVSGGHFNPAVTLGAFLQKRNLSDLIGYWIGQVAGAVLASAVVAWAGSREQVKLTYTSIGERVGEGSGFLLELALTAIFVLVILVSSKRTPGMAPMAMALTLAAVHFAAYPSTGASVNPARSLGPAIVGGVGAGLWVYLLAPLAGGAVAWFLYRTFGTEEATTT